jgi:BspA type Leucine rich repeat region (6 copies)
MDPTILTEIRDSLTAFASDFSNRHVMRALDMSMVYGVDNPGSRGSFFGFWTPDVVAAWMPFFAGHPDKALSLVNPAGDPQRSLRLLEVAGLCVANGLTFETEQVRADFLQEANEHLVGFEIMGGAKPEIRRLLAGELLEGAPSLASLGVEAVGAPPVFWSVPLLDIMTELRKDYGLSSWAADVALYNEEVKENVETSGKAFGLNSAIKILEKHFPVLEVGKELVEADLKYLSELTCESAPVLAAVSEIRAEHNFFMNASMAASSKGDIDGSEDHSARADGFFVGIQLLEKSFPGLEATVPWDAEKPLAAGTVLDSWDPKVPIGNTGVVTLLSRVASFCGSDSKVPDLLRQKLDALKPPTRFEFYPVTSGADEKQIGWTIGGAIGSVGPTLEIPSKHEDLPVLEISEHAFNAAESIVKLVLPEGLLALREGAFRCCRNLEEVILPQSLEQVGPGAFQYCGALKSIALGPKVVSIGDYAFDGAMKNPPSYGNYVILPDSLVTVGDRAFSDTGLRFLDMAGTKIEELPRECFRGSNLLESVELPANLRHLGRSVFEGCSLLQGIEVPVGVELIPQRAFCDCKSLTAVDLPDTAVRLGSQAFAGCSTLKEIKIPVTEAGEFGERVFEKCDLLETVQLAVHPMTFLAKVDPAAYFEGSPQINRLECGKDVLEKNPSGKEKGRDPMLGDPHSAGPRSGSDREMLSP